MDVPAGATQEEGNTGFSIHLLSAVPAWRLFIVSVQYDGGFLPDIMLLTQCYYHHRGTR